MPGEEQGIYNTTHFSATLCLEIEESMRFHRQLSRKASRKSLPGNSRKLSIRGSLAKDSPIERKFFEVTQFTQNTQLPFRTTF